MEKSDEIMVVRTLENLENGKIKWSGITWKVREFFVSLPKNNFLHNSACVSYRNCQKSINLVHSRSENYKIFLNHGEDLNKE